MGEAKIGYRRFRAEGKPYVYDTTTDAVVPLSEPADAMLDDYLRLSARELRTRFEPRLGRRAFDEVFAFLASARRHGGMFRPFFRKDFSRVLDPGLLRERLTTRLHGLALSVTEQCNQRCAYCVYSGNHKGERSHGERRMSWETARKCMDFFFPRAEAKKTVDLSFYGGEPLLEWDLVRRCIEYARESSGRKDIQFSVTTNLTLLTKPILEYLVENGIGISVSLDGPKHIHDRNRVFRTGRGTYRTVMRRLRSIRERSPEYFRDRVSFTATLDKNNDVLEVFDYFCSDTFGDAAVAMNAVKKDGSPRFSVSPERIEAHQARLETLTDRYVESWTRRNGFNYRLFRNMFRETFADVASRKIEPAGRAAHPNQICIPGAHRLFVTADGRFFPCEKVCPTGMQIGDADSGFDVRRIRRMLKTYVGWCEDLCQACWAYRLCGHCFMQGIEEGVGLRKRAKRSHCGPERARIENALRRFVRCWEGEPEAAREDPFSTRYAATHPKG